MLFTAELQRRMQAMECRCHRKILRISCKYHVTNKEVYSKIQQAIGPHYDLLTIVKRRTLKWYGHISRSPGLVKNILQATRGSRQGRQKKRWEDTSGNEYSWSSPSPRGRLRTGKIKKTGGEVIYDASTTPAVN